MKTFLFLLYGLFCINTFAETSSGTLPPPTTSAASSLTPSNTSQASSPSSFSLSKLKSKFKISYFSETLGPTIKKWDDNEYNDDGTKDRVPMTMYHSFGTRYLLTDRFNLYISPRFNTVIGDRNDLSKKSEQRNVYLDDWQFGFYYTFYKTNTFQYGQRLTHRAPFSRKSQLENIESQIEWQHDLTWVVTPSFRIIHWNNYRYYKYNDDSTINRYRINFRTLFNYTLTDKWLVQYMHELDLQHRSPNDKKKRGYRDFNYMNPYHDYSSFGVGYSPIPELTFLPFIRIMDNKNIRNETTIVGLNILGKVL